jgi:hypothetical protein
VHTHPDGSLPSVYTGDKSYGDLGFAANKTTRKPVFVFMMSGGYKDKVSFIISNANKSMPFSKFRQYATATLTDFPNMGNFKVSNLQKGIPGISLIPLVQQQKDNFTSLIK